MSDYFRQNAVITTGFEKGKSWAILSPIEMQLKRKIEEIGTPLKEWNIQINYGIKTGFNDAFIIDSKTKEELIAKSPKNAEIIRPILRGRDIKRYGIEYGNLWLLFIPWHFPLHNNPSIVGASKAAEEAFKIEYPDIYNHLLQFKDSLSDRNKSETGIRYEWYAMQRFGANYWREFDKPKITWGNLALDSQFSFTREPFIVNAPSPFFATENLYLLAILNSKIGSYYIRHLGVERNGGYIEFKPMYVEQIPIPIISEAEQSKFSALVIEILEMKKQNVDTKSLENALDLMTYEIYELTEEQIKLLR